MKMLKLDVANKSNLICQIESSIAMFSSHVCFKYHAIV